VLGQNPGLFTLKFHHGGEFTSFPGRKYKNGKTSHVDLVDSDEFSVHEVNAMIQELGYLPDDMIYYNFLVPGQNLDFGLRALGNDSDVLNLLQYVKDDKLIEIYTEHGTSKVGTYMNLSGCSTSSVIIEDITDEGMLTQPTRNSQQITTLCRRQLTLQWHEDSLMDEINNDTLINEEIVNEGNVGEGNVGEGMDNDHYVVMDDPVLTFEDGENVNNVPNDDEMIHQFMGMNDNMNQQYENVFNEEDDEVFNEEDDVVFNEENGQQEAFEDALSDEDDSEDDDFIVDEENMVEDVEVDMSEFRAAVDMDCEDALSDEDDSEDDDFIVDEENMVEDVEVDMSEFRAAVDMDCEDSLSNDESDYANEVDLDDFDSLSDEETDCPLDIALRKLRRKNKRNKEPIVDPFYVGKKFNNRNELKELVKNHAIHTRRQLCIVRNDTKRLRVICRGVTPDFSKGKNVFEDKGCGSQQQGVGELMKVVEKSNVGHSSQDKGDKSGKKPRKKNPPPTCPWTLHVTDNYNYGSWTVKTYINLHECLQTRTVRQCTVSWLAREVEHIVAVNPSIPLKALQEQIQQKHQIQVSIQKKFRAKSMASMKIDGNYRIQYEILRDYCDELLRSNPGSTVKIDLEREPNPTSPTRQFKRIYICLGALKAGFLLCGRPILGLDGCFMKGPYPGQILSAVGIDSNNGIYPLAYAMVEAETKESWTWFLEQLAADLNLSSNSNFTFISDRQKVSDYKFIDFCFCNQDYQILMCLF
jgi:hypothetical protein